MSDSRRREVRAGLAAVGICLVALSGCGGGDEPPRLEGPATLTSIADCFEKSGYFDDVSAEETGPIRSSTGEITLDSQGNEMISNPKVNVYSKETAAGGRLAIGTVEIHDSPEEAAQWAQFIRNESYSSPGTVIEITESNPRVTFFYNDQMPDEGITAIQLCAEEDY